MAKNDENKTKKVELQDTSNKSQDEDYQIDFSVVGIGASAGGLEALEQFFRYMPADTGLAFVVVQHLSPDYKSLMVELLAKHTEMKIYRVEDGMQLQPNCIYLIPPKKNMTCFHGKLYLTDQNHNMGLNLPIDIFFRSLAEDFGEKSIGVILSGTGSDGTLGIRAIKGAGGMAMVQEENSAKFDGMPKSAIATGLVDYIVNTEKMGEQLLKYTKHPYVSKSEAQNNSILEDEDTYSKILSTIRTQTGIDFTFYKPNTIVRRIERRISVNQIDNIDNYLQLLIQSPSEVDILYKEMLIGVTKFFRDQEAYDILKKKVIPAIFENKHFTDTIRIWVVGCSTGEEAYSLAILFQEQMEKLDQTYDIKIFATDIDKFSIEFASSGIYPESIATDVTEERLHKYFKKNNSSFRVTERIRQMVIFATHNITKDPPFSKIDMISCRNLLIYFQPIMQKKVLSAFRFSLNNNGHLYLGTSESVGELTSFFEPIDSKWKIYSCKEGTAPPVVSDFYIPVMNRKQSETTRGEKVMFKLQSEDHFLDEINSTLFEEFVPPAVVIDDHQELIHVFNDVNKFMKVPSGKMNLNILNMVYSDISIALGAALHKVQKEQEEITYKDLNYTKDEKIFTINLSVKPIHHKKSNKNLYLVVFAETLQKEHPERNIEIFERDAKVEHRVADLEQELKYTKENLQATIEELETSNEELQATNEELIASNEELQSTNEELQSVNEELYTVNSEYQNKIEELTELNNDINNWFNITNIGTIFLDLNLRIRKFTPAINQFVNLLDIDLGRSIKHISYNFNYPDFFPDIEDVLRTLIPKEIEVSNGKNSWFLMKMLPYRTVENAVKGVVVTFIDITKLKEFENKLENERDLLISVLDNSPIGKIMVDKEGYFTFANKRMLELLGTSLSELKKQKFNDPSLHNADADGNPLDDDELPFAIVKNTKEQLYNFTTTVEGEGGKSMKLIVHGSPILDDNDEFNGAVFSVDSFDRLESGK